MQRPTVEAGRRCKGSCVTVAFVVAWVFIPNLHAQQQADNAMDELVDRHHICMTKAPGTSLHRLDVEQGGPVFLEVDLGTDTTEQYHQGCADIQPAL